MDPPAIKRDERYVASSYDLRYWAQNTIKSVPDSSPPRTLKRAHTAREVDDFDPNDRLDCLRMAVLRYANLDKDTYKARMESLFQNEIDYVSLSQSVLQSPVLDDRTKSTLAISLFGMARQAPKAPTSSVPPPPPSVSVSPNTLPPGPGQTIPNLSEYKSDGLVKKSHTPNVRFRDAFMLELPSTSGIYVIRGSEVGFRDVDVEMGVSEVISSRMLSSAHRQQNVHTDVHECVKNCMRQLFMPGVHYRLSFSPRRYKDGMTQLNPTIVAELCRLLLFFIVPRDKEKTITSEDTAFWTGIIRKMIAVTLGDGPGRRKPCRWFPLSTEAYEVLMRRSHCAEMLENGSMALSTANDNTCGLFDNVKTETDSKCEDYVDNSSVSDIDGAEPQEWGEYE